MNSFRYATGWMELHDATGESIFQYYDTYNSTLFVLLGLTPVLFIFATSYRKVREDRKILALIAVYTITVLMISKYGVMLMGNFYYLENALRWASSKLWPAILVTYLVLFIVLMRALDFKKFKTVSIGMILLLLLYSLPWLQGKVLSNYVNVEMPDEYYTTFSAFDQQDKVLYYPPPQQLYFRQYDWGYFGSDFLNFMTKAEVIDIATVSDVNDFYFEMTALLQTCSADELKANGITHVVVDGSVTDHGELTLPDCAGWEVVEENEYFVVYEL
ncbi:MAG: hypothetical protein QY318_00945 [Candidatus Dojkabacteria bacterium]|nr:MAG: hypothetical protein QY318_00945 [Candidatus Dojkabacteria bacterium]